MQQDKTNDSISTPGLDSAPEAIVITGGQVDSNLLRSAEQAVAQEWKPGDVILDLYEVRKVREGFGEDAVEKDCHFGGFGRVYKVWHRGWLCEMAVKTPLATAFSTKKQRDAFVRECETWVNLGLHPNIASCHYVRELGGVPRVFSEYANAGTLESWIQSRRLYEGSIEETLARMLDVCIQFAWGLHYAHESGVIHQDVKPLNALMWDDVVLKVTDFGIAGARQHSHGAAVPKTEHPTNTLLVSQGGMTPAYCSPEQVQGERLSRRTDLWSWALSVVEIFCGGVTWQMGTYARQVLADYLQRGGDDPQIPAMPGALAAFLGKCFEENPDERPRDMHECAAAFIELYEKVTGCAYPRSEPSIITDTSDALNNRALSFIDLGNADEAKRLFDKAIEKDIHHLVAIYNNGLLQWRTAQSNDLGVYSALEAIKNDRPGDWRVHWVLGWVCMERGDYHAAREHFECASMYGGGKDAQDIFLQVSALVKPMEKYPRDLAKHPSSVRTTAFSRDARYALTGGDDRSIRIFEVASGKCVRRFIAHREGITAACFTPNGKQIVTGSSDKTVKVWDFDGDMISHFNVEDNEQPPQDAPVKSAVQAMFGEKHAFGFIQETMASCTREFTEHKRSITTVCVSPNSKLLLSGSEDRTLKLWNLSTGELVQTFYGHTKAVTAAAFSISGKYILSGSGDETVRLWEVSSGRCLRSIAGHWAEVTSVCFAPNGLLIASASEDKTIKVWANNGRCLCTFTGHTLGVNSICFSPDGKLMASGGDDYLVKIWELATGRCICTKQGHMKQVCSVSFAPNGKLLLSGSEDKTAKLWAVEKSVQAPNIYAEAVEAQEALKRQKEYRQELENAWHALYDNKIGDAIKHVGAARAVPGYERTLEVLDISRRIGVQSQIKDYRSAWLSRTLDDHQHAIHTACFTPEGEGVISENLILWDTRTGKKTAAFEGMPSLINNVCFTPNGKLFLCSGMNRAISVWNAGTQQRLRTLEGHTGAIQGLAAAPDNRCVVSGSYDTTLRLYDIVAGNCLRTFTGHTHGVNAVSFSRDGRNILSASDDKTLRLWDTRTGMCLQVMEGHLGAVYDVCFSPDKNYALSASRDKTLILWQLSDGKPLHTFSGHTDVVWSVCFSPDGKFVLSGSWDHTLKLWRIDSGACVRTFSGHTGSVNAVGFSPDGRFALSGSSDKSIRLWEIDWEYECRPVQEVSLQEDEDGSWKKVENEVLTR